MQLHHICIQSDCYAASLDFYTRVLGFQLVQETPGFHGRSYNTWLRDGDFYLELQTPKAGQAGVLPPEESIWARYISASACPIWRLPSGTSRLAALPASAARTGRSCIRR